MAADGLRVHCADEFTLADLCEQKGSTTISVCLPARNEEKQPMPMVDPHSYTDPSQGRVERVEVRWPDDSPGLERTETFGTLPGTKLKTHRYHVLRRGSGDSQ